MTCSTLNSGDPSGLSRRVNELYHDLQASQFDEVHRVRHATERHFWQREAAPRLRAVGCRFGVDLCTGTGFVPRVLLELLPPQVRIQCFDLSARALLQAEAHLREFSAQVTTQAADVRELPLPDAAADWVSLNAGLHHLPEPERTLKEVDRILKPGGFFCLGYEPNATFYSSRIVRGMERVIWNACWYLSPRRNLNRVRRKLGRQAPTYEAVEHLGTINAILLQEKLIAQPLTTEQLRRLVDVCAQSTEEDEQSLGFDPRDLLGRCLPGYEVECELYTDYGGEMLRRHGF
jgi:SAM-dependent methyltransferase